MEKIIQIDGQDVKFKATAATLRLYRIKFKRDLMKDLIKLSKSIEGKNIEIPDLELFENIAFIMAKQADNSIPDSVEDWLDNFSTFAIRDILPAILDLWNDNMQTISESKKNMLKVAGK